MSAAAGTAALAVVLALALLLAGCGGGNGDGDTLGSLEWAKPPTVQRPATLPNDRVLVGQVRNDSLRRVRIKATDVRIVDAQGRRVPGNVLFLTGFLHQLYPPTRAPERLPEEAQVRYGLLASMRPGAVRPINAAWRLAPGSPPAVRLEYPGGQLPIPRGAAGG